ncbi:hypothetical protein BH20ACT2_BH20ACT2_10730 [soil metagenome]
MSILRCIASWSGRHRKASTGLGAAVIAGAVLLGLGVPRLLDTERTAIPVPLAVYEIESVSNGHTASLLNLPLGQPGVPQAPIPVDIDGDLLPDVTAAVNLINAEGILQNPPDVGDVIAPNVEINRLVTAPILGQAAKPLKINIKLTILDLQGGPPTVVRFGYDTGLGGSIPTNFKAVLGGLQDFFNPLTAVVDTTGGYLGINPGLPDLGLGPVSSSYEGPLTLIGGVETAGLDADVALEYSPLPDALQFTYATDDAGGPHVTTAHDSFEEIDLDTDLDLRRGDTELAIDARVDRLPRQLAVDLLATSDGGGAVDYKAKSDGRAPDVGVAIARDEPDARPLRADIDITALPDRMAATWNTPEDGPISATFDSSGQGIGAIEARMATFDGEPTTLTPFVPSREQYLNVQGDPFGDPVGEVLVSGRLERVRHAELVQSDDGGFAARLDVGDGAKPFEAHVDLDLRDRGLPHLDALATVAPLPGSFSVDVAPGGDDQAAEPTAVTYEASEPVDVDLSAQVVLPEAEPAAGCGDDATICAELDIRNLPPRVETRGANFIVSAGSDEARFDVDSELGAGTGPDLAAAVTLGQPDAAPILIEAEVLGLTPFVRLRAVEGADETVELAEFHTCRRDYDAGSCDGTDAPGGVGLLDFAVRNFTERPADLPPLLTTTPNFATVSARGRPGTTDVVDFEATGRMADVAEVRYVNRDVFGLRTRVGGGGDLSAVVDVVGVALGDDPATGRIDVQGETVVSPVPGDFELCLSQAGRPVATTPADPITARCEDPDPFAGEPDLTSTPLSVAYLGDQVFDVATEATVVLHRDPADPDDDETIRGELDVTRLPRDLRTHLLLPSDAAGTEEQPLRLRYLAGEPDDPDPGAQPGIAFRGEHLLGDAVCQDPRPTATALCAAGTVANLPPLVDVTFDPAIRTDNLAVKAEGGALPVDLLDLELSSVEPGEVLVVEGSLRGLPAVVAGTIDLADPPAFNVTATPALGALDATFRNFIAPDPTPGAAPERSVPGFGTPTQELVVFQRGDALRAEAHITDVSSVGFRTQRDADGDALDTRVVDVGFGGEQVVRAHVDLAPDPTERIIGDAVLTDVPSATSICFRGKLEAGQPAPGEPAPGTATFCDGADDDEIAVEVARDPSAATASDLDVDAYFREESGGGGDVLAAHLRLDDVPPVVQGTFPSGADEGDLDVTVFDRAPADPGTLVPGAIARIEAEVASFDIASHGFTDPPFNPVEHPGGPFPAPVPDPANQHISLVKAGDAMHARLRIGDTDPAVASSRLHHVEYADRKCEPPDPAPPDYPHYPEREDTSYTCVRADFAQTSAAPDRLDLHVVTEDGAERLAVRDAGLTDVPAYLQITLADSSANLDDGSLRPRCTTEVDPQCVPPLLRFDQPQDDGVVLFGMLEKGELGDLGTLRQLQPAERLADLDTAPGADGSGWAEWDDPRGVRVKIGRFREDTDTEAATAAVAGLRVALPRSLTLAAPQSADASDRSGRENYFDASDVRIHLAARDGAGQPVPAGLGQLAGMVRLEEGSQVLLSAVCGTDLADRDEPDDCAAFDAGFGLPAELGIDYFDRNHSGFGRQLIQLDGRLDRPTTIGARIIGEGDEVPFGRLEAQIKNLPGSAPGDGPAQPSFRLRLENMGEGQVPPELRGEPGDECSFFFCVKASVVLQSVLAELDFQPGSRLPARRVEAVINQQGKTRQGMEVRAFDAVDGGGPTTATVEAELVVDPLDVFIRGGVPLVGGFHFILDSDLNARVSLAETERFRLRHNLLHLDATYEGDDAAKVGPIELDIALLHGAAHALFVKLFGVDFLPPGTLALPFLECATFGLTGSVDGFTVADGGTEERLAWPFADPRVRTSGVLKPLFDVVELLARPFFCLTDLDIELISDEPGAEHPSDPLGLDGLPVPGAPVVEDETVVDPPDTPQGAPDHTVSGDLALCGTHTFDTLEVTGTLRLATSPSDARTVDDKVPDCAAGALGRLQLIAREIIVGGQIQVPTGSNGALALVAEERIQVSGTIRADRVSTQVPLDADGNPFVAGDRVPGANSGGGHGAKGGQGRNLAGLEGPPDFDGGQPYGDTAVGSIATEAGMPGAAFGIAPGAGGGTIVLNAPDVTVTGSAAVTADGGRGTADHRGECAVENDPGTSDDESLPNTGHPGSGGGSGGGIVVNAAAFTLDGVLSANGGPGSPGKAGGGGGGAAGIIKIATGVLAGANDPQALGGGGGGNDGCADADAGDDGGDREAIVQVRPVSVLAGHENGRFWQRGVDGLDLPYSAGTEGSGFDVHLCGIRLSTDQVSEAIANAGDDAALDELFPMPNLGPGQAVTGHGGTISGGPCGARVAGGLVSRRPELLATDEASGNVVTDGDITTQAIDAEGDSGYWGLWTVVQRGSTFEANPAVPDLVLGIDNVAPQAVTVTSPSPVASASTSITVDGFDQDELSGFDRFECRNADAGQDFGAVNCAKGTQGWELLPAGDGTKRIEVRAFDKAGNVSDAVPAEVLLDTRAPDSSGAANLPDGLAGWHVTPPRVTLSGFDDSFPDSPGSGPAADPYVFRIDAGAEKAVDGSACLFLICPIDQALLNALTPGAHTVHWSGVDAAGNRYDDDDETPAPSPMDELVVRYDPEPPTTALLTGPAAPNDRGWFTTRPFVALSAIDGLGQSGVATTSYRLNGEPPEPYTGPFRLDPGVHTVCFSSVDVAGNVEAEQCTPDPIRVDDAAPMVSIDAPPADGDGGWHVSAPAVAVSATDAVSGVEDTFVSADERPYTVHDGSPIAIGEGLHGLAAYATDRAGNRSALRPAAFRVDLSDPVPSDRFVPPAPARGPWYRTVPKVHLRALDGDQNAGVASIEQSVDGGPFERYIGPFAPPVGLSVIEYRATDAAGRVGPGAAPRDVQIDLTPPVVRATAPWPHTLVRLKLLEALLGPQQTLLGWQLTEDLSGSVSVGVVVYDLLGNVVRRLDGGTVTVTPGATTIGSTVWDGRDPTLTGLVPVGTYYYRVEAVDEAGNVAFSGESRPVLLRFALCLPLLGCL